MERRTFLRRVGSLGAIGGGIAGGSSSAVATTTASTSQYDFQPADVTLEFDEDELETYRPLVRVDNLPVLPQYWYSWIARSDFRDTDVFAYWAWYPAQEGIADADSHVPDREPVYVYVDDVGQVEKVVYDGYHYLARTDPAPILFEDTSRVKLDIVGPWNFYRRTSVAGVDVTLRNLHDKYLPWLDAGWAVHRPAVVDPWSIRRRGHWWADQVRYRASYRRAQLMLSGLIDWGAGADQSDFTA